MQIKWMTEYDQFLAEELIPAVFVLSHEQELKIDVERTRDFVRENPECVLKDVSRRVWQHCVVVDDATSWPQYILFTHLDLCAHPRAQVTTCPDFSAAMTLLKQKRLGVYEDQRSE